MCHCDRYMHYVFVITCYVFIITHLCNYLLCICNYLYHEIFVNEYHLYCDIEYQTHHHHITMIINVTAIQASLGLRIRNKWPTLWLFGSIVLLIDLAYKVIYQVDKSEKGPVLL